MRAEQGAGPVSMKKAKNTWYGGHRALHTQARCAPSARSGMGKVMQRCLGHTAPEAAFTGVRERLFVWHLS